jgi:LPXTG-site transpeptidase (sortase) family protein
LQELAVQTYGGRLIQRIAIPAITVDSPVVTVGWLVDRTNSSLAAAAEWDSPGPAVGWVLTSALPDRPGNIILYGHNNMYGSVFKNLGKLAAGDALILQTGQASWHYQVDRVVLLPFLLATAGQRQAYQAYLADTALPRLTVISCWPPESNTYRLIVIAYPVLNP